MNNVLNISDVQATSRGQIWAFIAKFTWMN